MVADNHDAVLASLQAAGRLPSITAAVARGGVPQWRGSLSVDPAAPAVGVGSSYRIGSITKTLTAVLVLQLRDAGRLALDDPIGDLVACGDYGSATLRELLSHTSGLQSEPSGPWWERVDGGSLPELLAANAGSGRVAGPGEFYHYSNLGFALLGAAVARLHDASWWHVVQERLLVPLGMASTSYLPPADHAPGSSVDHFAHTLFREPHADTGAMAPAGQLWSTVDDLLRWADFLATGHPDVLSSATLAEMAEPSHAGAGESYGLGLRRVEVGGRTLIGHTGSMPGFLASLFVDRDTRDAVVALTNATTGLPTDLVPAAFLTGALPAVPVAVATPWRPSATPVPVAVTEVLGLWFWGHTGLGLEWVDETLVVRDLRTGELEERFRLADDGFIGIDGYHRGETLRACRHPDGTVRHLECATFVWTRTPYDPQAPIPGGPPTGV